MKRFVLIDHSLKDLGGHYYTYASCVLPAAERAGFKAVLATHQEFSDFEALPASWEVHASFRRKSYSQRTPDASSGAALRGWWTRMRNAWRTRERLRIAEGFAADCAALFEHVQLAAGDHVFLATASEVDLEGLALFLQRQPGMRSVHWHLQFHLGVFRGRDPDYAEQPYSKEAMRAVFLQALARVPQHRLHFYCTTDQLSVQYRHLGVASFTTLPYPVHPLFREGAARKTTNEPARIACLGHSRREKGYRELPIVVRKLWKDYLSKGRAQLVMQTRRRDLRHALDAVVGELGAHTSTPPVVYAPFPLELERYAELVRTSDVGLLLYDSARYYARCSGVLLEMLTAGVPVIVPAGCWLAEQIAEENQRHLAALAAASPVARKLSILDLSGRTSDRAPRPENERDRDTLIFDHRPVVSEFDVQTGSTSLLLRFRWSEPSPAGVYVQLDLEQLSADGAFVSEFAVITGPRPGGQPVHVMFHLAPGAVRARVAWRNAWDEGSLTMRAIEYLLLEGDHRPAGAVGLTAANMDQSGELLDDVLRHIEHYRLRASVFAEQCAQHHNADQIIALLTAARPSALAQPDLLRVNSQ